MMDLHPTVMIVEDDHASRKLIALMLKKLGMNVLEAETGEEAVEIINKKVAHLFLLDISLGPGMSGVDVMHYLRKRDTFRETPILAVTAHSIKEIQDHIHEQGFSEYVGKPLSYPILKTILDKYNLDSDSIN